MDGRENKSTGVLRHIHTKRRYFESKVAEPGLARAIRWSCRHWHDTVGIDKPFDELMSSAQPAATTSP